MIVPVYNREKLIIRCLDSIARQTVKPDELIVVDNASTDSTREVVENWIKTNESYIKVKLFSESHPGACPARQKGFDNATGEFLIFFDSDDEMYPELIEKVVKSLSEERTADIICWKCRIKLLDGTYRIPPFNPFKPLENHLIHGLLRPQGYMVRKTFLQKAQGWTKQIEVWNDYELGLRLLLSNPKICAVKEVLAEIYSQEESITGHNFSSKSGKWEKTLDEMHRENQGHAHSMQKRVENILNYRRAILAAHYYREGEEEKAIQLLKTTLNRSTRKQKFVLLFSYYYTSLGLRGAWRIVRHLI